MNTIDKFSHHKDPELNDRLNKLVSQSNENFTSHSTALQTHGAQLQQLQQQLSAALARIADLESNA